MAKPALSSANRSQRSRKARTRTVSKGPEGRALRSEKNSDVLISAVISSYLLTHLHNVLQHSEYAAIQEGRASQAANFAQLRKVLCMDARSMADASAIGIRERPLDKFKNPQTESNAA